MRVFISHASEDKGWALELSRQLAEKGLGVWTAEENLFPGDNWALEAGRALEQSDALVVLISPEALASRWVQSEWQYALGLEKFQGRLLPVIVRQPTTIPWILRRLQALEGDPTTVSRRIAQVLLPSSPSQGSEARVGSR